MEKVFFIILAAGYIISSVTWLYVLSVISAVWPSKLAVVLKSTSFTLFRRMIPLSIFVRYYILL